MANTLSSRTSAVAGNVVTHRVPAKQEGVHCYLKYTKGDGTKVSILFAFVDPDLHATDEYQPIYMAGAVTPAVQTYEFSVSGNYRIPVPMALSERVVKATVTFTDGATQALVVDFRNQ
jgi:hypothetical protein